MSAEEENLKRAILLGRIDAAEGVIEGVSTRAEDAQIRQAFYMLAGVVRELVMDTQDSDSRGKGDD